MEVNACGNVCCPYVEVLFKALWKEWKKSVTVSLCKAKGIEVNVEKVEIIRLLSVAGQVHGGSVMDGVNWIAGGAVGTYVENKRVQRD